MQPKDPSVQLAHVCFRTIGMGTERGVSRRTSTEKKGLALVNLSRRARNEQSFDSCEKFHRTLRECVHQAEFSAMSESGGRTAPETVGGKRPVVRKHSRLGQGDGGVSKHRQSRVFVSAADAQKREQVRISRGIKRFSEDLSAFGFHVSGFCAVVARSQSLGPHARTFFFFSGSLACVCAFHFRSKGVRTAFLTFGRLVLSIFRSLLECGALDSIADNPNWDSSRVHTFTQAWGRVRETVIPCQIRDFLFSWNEVNNFGTLCVLAEPYSTDSPALAKFTFFFDFSFSPECRL